MLNLKRIGLLLSLVAFSFGYAQNTLIPVDGKLKKGKLSNGLTYYIRPNQKPEKKVELRLVINAGSILEDDDQQGLAHMCEHMAFNGTKNFKKNDIISYLQSIGVGFGNDLNAYTSFDETVYMLPIPTDKPGNLEKGFQILEDWAHHVTYLDEDIEGERNIILEESRMGKGAEDRMERKVFPVLYGGSKYAERLPIGKDSIIKNHKYETIRRFYKDWYRPNLMAVVVVGDIDVATAEAMIKKHFEGLTNPANERARTFYIVPPYAKNQSVIATDKEATMYQVQIAYSAFPDKQAQTVEEYREDIIREIYTTALNLRLRELTQKPNPPYLGAMVNFGSYARGFSSFQAMAYAGKTDINKAITALAEEIERVKKFGFTAAEIERVKTNMLTRMERMFKEKDKTESESYVGEYVRNFLENEPIPGIELEYNYYKTTLPLITIGDVNKVSEGLKATPNYTASISGPDAADVKLPSEKELVDLVSNAANSKNITAYEEKAVSTNLFTKTLKSGKIVSTVKNEKLATTTYVLSNGVKVTLKKTDYKNDQILMNARRFGGQSNYGIADKFSANFLSQVIGAMGLGNYTPTDLRKALTGKTANVSPLFTSTLDGFNGSSSVKDFETMLQLLNLYVYEPRKDTALFRTFVQKGKQQTTFMLANPQTVFIDTLFKTLYGNNPLAPVVVPKGENFDKISLDRVMAIFKERFTDLSGMHFTFVGSLPKDTTEQLILKYIASLPVTPKKFTFKDNGVRTKKGKVDLTVHKGKEPKALILAVYSGEVPYSDDLALKADAISEVLNIKVIEELREKIQGIYSGGIYSQFEKYPVSSYNYFAQLPCGPEKVDTLIKALNAEIENIKTKGPSVEDLNKVKQQWIEQYKSQLKENNTWLSKLTEIQLEGFNADRFLNYEKYVNALTPEQIKATAQLLLNGKNIATAILLPEVKK